MSLQTQNVFKYLEQKDKGCAQFIEKKGRRFLNLSPNFQQNKFHFISESMKNFIIFMIKTTILFSLILSLSLAAVPPPKFDLSKLSSLSKMFTAAYPLSTSSSTSQASTVRKGMTWQVSDWPIESNSWAARVGCGNCDAKNGDTLCTERLPLLCLIDYKTIPRPRYNFPRDISTASVSDGGFSNGWTGGYFSATDPVLGSDLTNRNVADKICQDRFGATARVLDQSLPLYMGYMNDLPNVGQNWDWSKTQTGGEAAWGFIKGTLPCGRMWTWIQAQASANCGA